MAYLYDMMKNALVACALGLMCSSHVDVVAQITLTDAPDTVQVYLDELEVSGTDFAKADWGVVNEGTAPIALMVTRTLVDTVSPFNYPFDWMAPGSYERFCWGAQCYNFGSNSSAPSESFLVTIEAGQTDFSFQSDFYPADVLGSSTLEYCFHEVDDLVSGVCHQVTFVVDASVGLDVPAQGQPGSMSITPNPASTHATFEVNPSLAGVLEFRNLVGQVVKTETLQPGMSRTRVELDELADGIWLVSHRVDGVVVVTKRLVKH